MPEKVEVANREEIQHTKLTNPNPIIIGKKSALDVACNLYSLIERRKDASRDRRKGRNNSKERRLSPPDDRIPFSDHCWVNILSNLLVEIDF
jgi:hypothetical protein